ncbi:MAG: protein kinase, partial [Terriglobia bacterium]
MGEVFLVEDLWENARQVALKKLRRGVLSDATREFFVREFTALKQLRHPNLSSVYDFGYTPQGDPFFTSEYCMGEDLITGTAQMGFSEKLERAVEICRALAYIHARGYIHADLKPENILVLAGTRTENASIKLLDFGLARHIDDQARHRLSGTLAYLAPEAIKGRPFDVRSDLYALGVAFYQLFSRQSPYGDIDPQLLVDMKLNVNPAPPTEKDGTLPVAMDGILLRLLERDPDDRFQSPDEIVKAINQGLGYQFEIETDETARDYVRSGRFVGRAAEQTQLKKALQQVLKGAGGRLVLVGGESGVGKTRLLEELKIQAQLEGVRTFVGAAYEKITQPFQCFLDILRIMILSAQQTTSANRSLSNKYDTVLSKILPGLFEGKPQPGTPPSPSANEKELLLESLAAFVMEVCAEHPTLILIQDIHWADGLSLQLIERIARSLQSQRLILGVSYRSDEVKDSALEAALPLLSGLESCDSILLRPLSQQEVGDLVNSMMGTERAPASLVQRIVNETKGNPFFIQEVIWTWMEEKIISPRSGAWNPEPAELDSLRVPQTMADAFLRRIRSLSKSERDLLQIMALFIKPVPLAALSYVLGDHSSQVEVELERLVERAILARLDAVEGPQYFFQHAQMKQTLEVRVSSIDAHPIHSRIASYFEGQSAAGISDYAETLAYHFAMSGNKEKARFYSIR